MNIDPMIDMECYLSIFTFLIVSSNVCLSIAGKNDGKDPFERDESCPKECNCSKNLTTVNCARKNLNAIPQNIPTSVIILYLGHNYISKIEKESFVKLRNLRDLYVNNNRISFIDDGAFRGLFSLKLLSLTSNKLTELKPDALRDLIGIETLFITSNNLKEMPDLASVPMNKLKYLTINNNQLKMISLCTKEAVIFYQLGSIVLSNNKLHSLNSTDFVCTRNMTKINFSGNNIVHIADDSFSSLKELQSISFSYNQNFSWQTLMNLTSSLAQNGMLNSLDLSGVLVRKELKLNATTFAKFTKCPIKYLLLSNSVGVFKIENGTFDHFSKLETLDLSRGELSEIEDSFFKLQRLKDLRLMRNNLKFSSLKQISLPKLLNLDFKENKNEELNANNFLGFARLETLTLTNCKINRIFTKAFAGLPSLRKLDLSENEIGGSNLPSDSFTGSTNLKEINLSRNKMTQIPTEHTLFEKLFQLEILDISDNNCNNISNGIFKDQINLKQLKLSGNKLGHQFITFTNNSQLFQTLKYLKLLDLHDNEITCLPEKIFDGLNSSETINLSSNHIISIKPLLYKETTSLLNLDISKNKLMHLNPEDLLSLPSQTRLNLNDNPFDCFCDLQLFMYWLRKQNSTFMNYKLINLKHYKCQSPVSMSHKLLMEFDPDSIGALCNWVFILLGSMSVLLIIVVAIGLLLFRYRWHIRFRWYLFQKGRKTKRLDGTRYGSIPLNDGKSYEITISYHKCDQCWIFDKLIPRLEQWKRGIHDDNTDTQQTESEPIDGFLFAGEYNSILGKNEFNQICEAMMVSNRIILCITKGYLNSYRHLEEIGVANHSRHELQVEIVGDQGIVLILLEPGIDLLLPASIRPLRALNKFCEWSEREDRQLLFWNKLREMLKI